MSALNFQIPEYIKTILSSLNISGFEAYVVGGCVRDTLLNLPVNDWDVCTSALPEEVKSSLSDFNVIETGIEHGTVSAVKNGQVCEITTFRCEGSYSDHRHPDSVSFTKSIESDLERRDFTINAMAYSHSNGLIDLFSGQDDLNNGIIKCVGSPKKRFDEDALRIMRALRFSACLGFEIEKETKKAILNQFQLLKFVANERISSELSRLLKGKYALKVLENFKPVFDFVFDREISLPPKLIDFSTGKEAVALAYILFHTPPEKAAEILQNLRFSKKNISDVCFLLENRNIFLEKEKIKTLKLLSGFGRERLYLLADFIYLSESKEYKTFADTLPEVSLTSLAITGNDIISLGVSPGKEIKILLNSALNAVLTDKCKNDKESLIKYIKENFENNLSAK